MTAPSILPAANPWVDSSGSLKNISVKSERYFYVKTNRFASIGILQGDLLVVVHTEVLQTGMLMVVRLGRQLVLRRLLCFSQNFLLEPIGENLQSLEWPRHVPLPVLGVVSRLERQFI